MVAPLCVSAGAVVWAGEAPCHTLIHILTVCPVVLEPLPAVTDVGAIGVEAMGEGDAGFILHSVAFIHIPAISAVSFIAIFAAAVEGTLVLMTLSQLVAGASGIQASVVAHTGASVVHHVQRTRTRVGTKGVVARHVPAASRGQLTFVHILTNKAITMVPIQALADIGPI